MSSARPTGMVLLLSTLAGLAGACGMSSAPDLVVPETIFHNGRFVTVNESFDIAEAVAVRDGRIVAVGSAEDVMPLAGAGTRLVDMGGRTVLPGFNDSHVHLSFGRPEAEGRLDLRHVANLDELKEALAAAVARVPAGEWIVGSLSETSFPEAKLPTRHDLDAVSPNHPVALRRGPHIWIVNSRALEVAGITRSTPQPAGGVIARDERGEPNGILREQPAQRLVGRHLPPAPEPTDDVAREGLHAMLRELVSLGITSGNVAGIRPGDEFRWVQETYAQWGHELPRLTIQLRVSPGFDSHDDLKTGVARTIEEIRNLSVYTGFGDDRLKIGAIKMSVDGGFTGSAAKLLEPYPDGTTGAVRIPSEALYEVARYAHDRGWQLGIHAIGDGGVQLAVDVLDRVLRESPREDHRHYLHHVSVLPPEETLRKMAANDILVSSQPNFTYDLAPYYAVALQGERLERNNPQRSLARRGIRLAYGSDHRPYGPIVAIWAAVTREGRDGRIYGADEAVTVEEAIRYHTLGSAYLTFDEDELGSIEVGKLADMVVLTHDILTIEPARIREIGIEQTIIGGEIVYTADRPRTAKFDDGEFWYVGGESSRRPRVISSSH
mgnify:CR=1 FL=1